MEVAGADSRERRAEVTRMNPSNPWLRFLAGIVAIAIATRVAYELVRPVLPVLVAIVAVVAIVRLVGWHRGRW